MTSKTPVGTSGNLLGDEEADVCLACIRIFAGLLV